MRKIIIVAAAVAVAATAGAISFSRFHNRAAAATPITKQQQGELNDWSTKLQAWSTPSSTTASSLPATMPDTGTNVMLPVAVAMVSGTGLAYMVRLRKTRQV